MKNSYLVCFFKLPTMCVWLVGLITVMMLYFCEPPLRSRNRIYRPCTRDPNGILKFNFKWMDRELKWAKRFKPRCILRCCWCANASPDAPTSNLWPSHRSTRPPAKVQIRKKLSLASGKSPRFSVEPIRVSTQYYAADRERELVHGISMSSLLQQATGGAGELFFCWFASKKCNDYAAR